MAMYVGVNGTPKEISSLYVGVNGVPKEVNEVYAGDGSSVKLVVKASSL